MPSVSLLQSYCNRPLSGRLHLPSSTGTTILAGSFADFHSAGYSHGFCLRGPRPNRFAAERGEGFSREAPFGRVEVTLGSLLISG